MSVIDTSQNVSTHLVDLKNRGVEAVGRYYSPSASHRITRPEALAITNAGIKIFAVFEAGGRPTLSHDNGVHHAQIAVIQAQAVGQPEGTAICFALEGLPGGYSQADVHAVMEAQSS